MTNSYLSIDTIVVPAREETFKNVFLNEKQWYGIGIRADMVPLLKYIAIYRTAPISAITHWAIIESVIDSKSDKRFVITIKGEPQEIEPISNKEKFNNKKGIIVAHRYTNFKILKQAVHFIEACPSRL